MPIKPFPIPPPDPPAIEVEQFVLDRASFCDTFDSYINHLYVYPMNLRYEHQKSFAKVSSIQKFIQVLYSFLSWYLSFQMWKYFFILLVFISQARNIACCIEIRDSDEENAIPLKVWFSEIMIKLSVGFGMYDFLLVLMSGFCLVTAYLCPSRSRRVHYISQCHCPPPQHFTRLLRRGMQIILF